MIAFANIRSFFSLPVANRAIMQQNTTALQDTRSEESEHCWQQTFHNAFRWFARQHPQWVSRGFDDVFLRDEAAHLLERVRSANGQVTGMDLARLWDKKCGLLLPAALRVQQLACLADAAGAFLQLLAMGSHRCAHTPHQPSY